MYVIFWKATFPQSSPPLNQIIQYRVLLSRWVHNKKQTLLIFSDHMHFSPVFHVAFILVFCTVFVCCVSCTQNYQYLSNSWLLIRFSLTCPMIFALYAWSHLQHHYYISNTDHVISYSKRTLSTPWICTIYLVMWCYSFRMSH